MSRNKILHLTLPEPCSEDWNKMTPTEHGRFCDKCQKCVIDFRGFSDAELYRFFEKNTDNNICGWFRNSQLDRDIPPPDTSLSHFYKWALAAGLTLLLTTSPDMETFAQAPFNTEQVSAGNKQQYYGYIYGVVTDRYGRRLPNVKISMVTKDVVQMSTVTDRNGIYKLNATPTGHLTLVFELDGYQKYKLTSVPVMGRNAQLFVPFRMSEARATGVDDSLKTYTYRQMNNYREHYDYNDSRGGPPPFPHLRRK